MMLPLIVEDARAPAPPGHCLSGQVCDRQRQDAGSSFTVISHTDGVTFGHAGDQGGPVIE